MMKQNEEGLAYAPWYRNIATAFFFMLQVGKSYLVVFVRSACVLKVGGVVEIEYK